MKKNVCWFLAVMLFCAVAYGGCGGNSSSLAEYDDESQSQDVTPTPTPQPQSQDITPTPTPTNPGGQSSTYDFSVLAGTWTASNGTGTVQNRLHNPDGTVYPDFPANLSTEYSNIISFRNVNVSGSTATIDGTSQICWFVNMLNGTGRMYPDLFGGKALDDMEMEFAGLEFHNTDGNTWVMERMNESNETIIARTVITFTSPTTTQVERFFGNMGFDMNGSYTLTKTSDAY